MQYCKAVRGIDVTFDDSVSGGGGGGDSGDNGDNSNIPLTETPPVAEEKKVEVSIHAPSPSLLYSLLF